jgi:hypothetical protein
LEVPTNNSFPAPAIASEAVAFRYLAEDAALSVITSGGDIVLFKIDRDDLGLQAEDDAFVQVSPDDLMAKLFYSLTAPPRDTTGIRRRID